MHADIDSGNHVAAAPYAIAVPIGDDTAGAFDDGNDRGDVPALELGFDHEIDESESDKRIGVAIAPVTRQPAEFLDAPIKLPLRLLEMQHRVGGADHRVGQLRAGARGKGRGACGVAKLRLAGEADEA